MAWENIRYLGQLVYCVMLLDLNIRVWLSWISKLSPGTIVLQNIYIDPIMASLPRCVYEDARDEGRETRESIIVAGSHKSSVLSNLKHALIGMSVGGISEKTNATNSSCSQFANASRARVRLLRRKSSYRRRSQRRIQRRKDMRLSQCWKKNYHQPRSWSGASVRPILHSVFSLNL